MRSILILSMLLFGVACSKVPAGHVGVKVYLLGGSKGVDHEVLGVGRYYIGMNEELYLFPTFQQNATWGKTKTDDGIIDESITFQSKEGMALNADFGITYSLKQEHIATIFTKYRRGVNELTDTVVRNIVRDQLGEESRLLTVEENFSLKTTELMSKVKAGVKSQLDPLGIVVDDLYLVGRMRLPPAVEEAINNKIEATQRAQQRENELREAEADAKKKVAEAEGKAASMIAIAEAEAKSNALKQRTLTNELIQYEAVQRWDGKFPTTMAGGAVPFINIK